MSEKVLGFKEKEAKRLLKKVSKEFGKGYPYIIEHNFELLEIIEYILKQQASESVELKWLEKYCRIIPSKSLTQYEIGYTQAFKDLLYAVRAKAKKANK